MPSVDSGVTPRRDVPLAPLTTLGVGGHAQWFVRATTMEEAAAALKWGREAGVATYLVGGGSNIVVADSGYDGLVLQIAIRGLAARASGETTVLQVGAGEPWDDVVAASVARGLAGLECLSGIPGTAGGTPIQNVGAYGQDVAQCIAGVTVLDRGTGDTAVLTGTACGFGYRTSRFKGTDAGRFLVCDVTFELATGSPTLAYPDLLAELERKRITSPTLADVRRAVLSIRRRKGMVIDPDDVDTRSVGSFFMNPVVDVARHAKLMSETGQHVPGFVQPAGTVKVPAAWLIEHAGFRRGYRAGGAGISSRHPLALVNTGGATAREIVALAAAIKRRVGERFGIWLRPEPAFVGFGHDPDVSFLEETPN